MEGREDTAVEALLEQLITHGPNDIAGVVARDVELAMERERFPRAGRHERTAERQGCKPRRVDAPAGSVTVQAPGTAGHGDAPFGPQSLERGRRSVRAVMLVVAESWPSRGRDVHQGRLHARSRSRHGFGIESLSSSRLSRATRLPDEELHAWRDRPLGEVSYLSLNARHERMRHGGVVRDVAVLSAIRVGPDERRCILGASSASPWSCRRPKSTGAAFSKASWRGGLRGVTCVASDGSP